MISDSLTQSRKKAPNQPGLYFLKMRQLILYVGMASNLNCRLNGYHHVLDNIEPFTESVCHLDLMPIVGVSLNELASLESIAIKYCNPPLNSVQPSVVVTPSEKHIKALKLKITMSNNTAQIDSSPYIGSPGLVDVFRRLCADSSAKQSFTKNDWDLTEESKNAVANLCQALRMKPQDVTAKSINLLYSLIESRLDPQVDPDAHQNILNETMAEASELYSIPIRNQLLEVWLNQPERPELDTVCISVFQKTSAHCSAIDLAKVLHKLDLAYGGDETKPSPPHGIDSW